MASSRALWSRLISAGAPNRGAQRSSLVVTPQIRKERIVVARCDGLVLGIDPSVRGTGLALVDCSTSELRLIESRTLAVPRSQDFIVCLAVIHKAVLDLLARYSIARVGVEETIFVQNVRTSQLLGCARGAALGPIAAAGIHIVQLSPKSIKMAVSTGGANKEQVQKMISALLRCPELAPDEADAAAAAIAASRGDRI